MMVESEQLQAVIKVLKERFKTLSTDDAVQLALEVIAAVQSYPRRS